MTTAYCLSYECCDYLHNEIVEISTDKAAVLEHYNQLVAECKDKEDYDGVDCITVEKVDANFNEDGSYDYDIDYGDVIDETIFVEPDY